MAKKKRAKRKPKAKPVLEWKRKQLRGISAKKRKEWYDSTKRYRIVWSAEYAGIDLKEHYGSLFHASVRAQTSGGPGWGRLPGSTRPFYRTLKTAQQACEIAEATKQPRRRV